MRRFQPAKQAGKFLSVHAAVYNLFNLACHLIKAAQYRALREGAFGNWSPAAA